ncbi:hypothetical protein MUK42_35435 [Musa troglodytarum]|uniref:Uncharacterized protein n=1 Tax=Musa troglodytarum TaxID=320322 RepID=A0A9E7GKR4_9LILI|nr:hypothetical protein MUK42_35435 [Musa troglodytarum]URE13809.1 hypothetical protein MUK42_35435 [Musa troglodytarum]URE13810.1 hypothetical protein MUK42_35435 [Musa troglodytarum]
MLTILTMDHQPALLCVHECIRSCSESVSCFQSIQILSAAAIHQTILEMAMPGEANLMRNNTLIHIKVFILGCKQLGILQSLLERFQIFFSYRLQFHCIQLLVLFPFCNIHSPNPPVEVMNYDGQIGYKLLTL